MDLHKHKRLPAPNCSREILLDITKNFINPSHILLKKEKQAETKEEAAEEEKEKETERLQAMAEVCASSQIHCRNGNYDAESPASPPCRRRSSIKDSDEFYHRKPPMSFAMDSPVFTSRNDALCMSLTCEPVFPHCNINQRGVSSDPCMVFLDSQERVQRQRRKVVAEHKEVLDQKMVLPQQEGRRTVSDPEVVMLQCEDHKLNLDSEEDDDERVEGSDLEMVLRNNDEQLRGEHPSRQPQRVTVKRDVVLGTEVVSVSGEGETNQREARTRQIKLRKDEEDVELSVVAFVFDALRRSGLSCKGSPDDIKMDIGRPTDVRHIAHVTFDRFNGFLGLPAEFQMQIPRIAPSASVSAFGVSAQSMQCSYDRRGNSVPTILLLLQETLYDKKGLRAEGIFRINAENSQEEHVRSQLNHGVVPHDVDVHCLAGMIKAWFRELPRGVLDSLSPDQVMQCNSEEQAVNLMKTLPPMERGLLDWGINLMADVVHEEHYNKMNAHNIAMVFAPNMTQVSDPLIALMHAVQVMNLLKMLILTTLRDRNTGYRAAKGSDSASSLLRRDCPDGYESSHESKGRFVRKPPPKYEYEYFVERQGSSSNVSKSMCENTTMAKPHDS